MLLIGLIWNSLLNKYYEIEVNNIDNINFIFMTYRLHIYNQFSWAIDKFKCKMISI